MGDIHHCHFESVEIVTVNDGNRFVRNEKKKLLPTNVECSEIIFTELFTLCSEWCFEYDFSKRIVSYLSAKQRILEKVVQ